MNKETVKIGRINSKTEKALGYDLKDNIFCFMLEETLRDFTSRWPKDYLRKIEEASNIIREPLYVGLDKENKMIYLVKDYLVNNSRFLKACLILSFKSQLQIRDIIPFDDKKLQELAKTVRFNKVVYTK